MLSRAPASHADEVCVPGGSGGIPICADILAFKEAILLIVLWIILVVNLVVNRLEIEVILSHSRVGSPVRPFAQGNYRALGVPVR